MTISTSNRPNGGETGSPARGAGPTGQAGTQSRSRRRGLRWRPEARIAPWWWVIPALALLLALHYAAVGVGSVYSFTDWRGIGPFNWVGFDNYVKLFSSDLPRKALVNTIVLAFLFLIITNVLGILLALALNRTLKSRHFLRVLLFTPVVLSPLAVAYVWKFIFQQEGPLNLLLTSLGLESWTRTWLADPSTALWTVLAVLVWQHLGLAMVIYLAGLAGVPAELEEAAQIDGAGAFRRFVNVVLPLLRPSIVICFTLLLIRGMSIFDQVLAMTNGGPFGATDTLSTLVYKETFVNGHYGYGAAISVTLTILIAVAAGVQMGLLRRKED
jgi:raffinose/stachyose/melibiose transport system permease protein